MKKVLCLYRVSTKSQVSAEDDLPMQRRECLAFIEQHSDWVFYDERLEKGVSGFKVSAMKRDVILEIRALAEKNKFDILLVFMFDRLGRREDETPFLVEWFINNGIEVWSTREGQQTIANRSDKLINYIRFWQAGGESEKTSMRVKAAHAQMTSDGIWRGGLKPYGYKLVHNGRVGKKNNPLYDLQIDEVEGPIVQEIFDLVTTSGYGTYRAANFLNAKYPNPGKVWTAQTILSILRNPIYTGRMHMNDIRSEPIESLRLVSDSDMQFAEYALQQRIPRRYPEHRKAENDLLPLDAPTKTTIYGASLLSGILYCAHCGSRLVGSYCTKQRATGAYHRPIYRDFNHQIKAKGCNGQTVYSAKKLDDAVMEVARQYFRDIQQTVDSVWKEQARTRIKNNHAARLKTFKANLGKLQTQRTALRQEVVNSLTGESDFDTAMLKELLIENEAAVMEAEASMLQSQSAKDNADEGIHYINEQYQNITDWAVEFESADCDTKKMILAKMIERIDVDRGYHITITFFITEEEFEQAVQNINTDVTIKQAENTISTILEKASA